MVELCMGWRLIGCWSLARVPRGRCTEGYVWVGDCWLVSPAPPSERGFGLQVKWLAQLECHGGWKLRLPGCFGWSFFSSFGKKYSGLL